MSKELQKSDASIMQYYNKDNVSQMLTMANTLVKSEALPSSIQNAHQAFAVLQTGAELGLAPMTSLNSLYIVKGTIKPYGIFWSKKLREHGWKIQYNDKKDECYVIISKESEKHEYTARKSDIPRSNAIKFAPVEKLRFHALSRLVQFSVPEVMEGGAVFAETDIVEADIVEIKEEKSNEEIENFIKKINDSKTEGEMQEIMMENSKFLSDKKVIEAKDKKMEEFKTETVEIIEENETK